MNIERTYIELCNRKSDINEHLPTLYRYGQECKHITELGVREVISVYAFLHAKPDTFIGYDLYTSNNINRAKKLATESGIDFKFIEGNVLEEEIEQTDLLFIDTWHRYKQLKEELLLHSSKVNKYIILHDTTKYAEKDEVLRPYIPKELDVYTEEKRGLWAAVEEFLENNNDWTLKERFTNNNGLTVLEKNGGTN